MTATVPYEAWCGHVGLRRTSITNVCVLLFKELSQIDGEYLYNPASALCMAEIGKFLVSCCVRLATKQLITNHFCPSPYLWS